MNTIARLQRNAGRCRRGGVVGRRQPLKTLITYGYFAAEGVSKTDTLPLNRIAVEPLLNFWKSA